MYAVACASAEALSIECIDIITVILYCYNIVTMYYIAITVFEYRYNCIELDNDLENVNGSKCSLLIMVNCVY